ncbi:MAG: hypothetical protein ABIQ11_06025 [Saprospiraceae bacterium]
MKASDRYITLDACDCTSELLVNGWPDEVKFKSFVSRVIARAKKKKWK